MPPNVRILAAICFLLAPITQSSAFSVYRDRIPNGYRVPHPCIEGEDWQGVGHLDPLGGAARNPFGVDFKKIGRLSWTIELCLLDSDGDGYTNGEELGDPDCVWSEGDTPERITDITHPGVCNPFTNAICAGQSTFVTCEKIEPSGNLDCDNLNRNEVSSRDYTIPRTRVPRKETTYMCYTFNAPTYQDHYLIGMEPLIDNQQVVHHIHVYGCPDSKSIRNQPMECGVEPPCDDVIDVWAVGSSGLCLPGDVGFLFGPNGYKKIQFGIHWDNTMLQDNLYDASGLRFHFEPARPGIFTAGTLMMGSSLLNIPPNRTRHEEQGGCDGECTSQIWTDSLHIVGGSNHMHYIGVEQTTSWWREGRRIRDIAHDPQASMNPVYHWYDTPLVMSPGDTVQTTCVYDSSDRRIPTYYGEGTNDEVCYFLAFYYPKENSHTSSCNEMGPLSQCEREARTPIGNCDWSYFVNGVVSRSLPVAQDLESKCALTGQCYPECQKVVEELKRHPCMQDDMILFISTRMQDELEGVRFLARYSSCLDEVCPTTPTAPPLAGSGNSLRSERNRKGIFLTATFVTLLISKVLS